MIRLACRALFASLSLSVSIAAQEAGCLQLDGFGMGMAALGDVDGDGHDDFAVSAPKEIDPANPEPGNHGDTGEVLLLSGRTFEPLWRQRAKDSRYFGKQLVALDDIDGDGRRDLAVSSHDHLWTLSGATGATLWSVPTGSWMQLASVPDVDGDDHADAAVIAYGERLDSLPGTHSRGAESLHRWIGVFSGRSGEALWTRESDENMTFNGQCVGVGDRDGDDRGDLVCLGHVIEGRIVNSAAASVLSGADGSTVEFTLLPFEVGESGGLTPARLVVVGNDTDEQAESLAFSDGFGKTWLIPGGRWTSPVALGVPGQHKLFGYALAAIHDLDGDEVADVLVTGKFELDPAIEDGMLWAYSGRAGVELPALKRMGSSILRIDSGGYGFGARVVGLGDVDADCTQDFGIAAVDDWLGSRYPGAVIVFSGKSGSVIALIR